MDFYALVEEWPHETLIGFRELPGCLASAPTFEEALQRAPDTITTYLGWLKQNNIFFLTEEVNSINVVVREHLHADRIAPLFETELIAPTDQEMTNALSVAAVARLLIADLYNGITLARRGYALKPDEWSLTEHLRHILQAEAHYIGCLSDQPTTMPDVAAAELADRLVENGKKDDAFLRGLSAEQRAHVHVHGESEWTAAKVLRRMAEHLRDHYPTMQEIARRLSMSDQQDKEPES